MRGRKPDLSDAAQSGAMPAKPDALTGEAGAEWDRVCADLRRHGLLDSADRGVITAWCSAWGAWAAAERVLAAEGLTYELRGQIIPRPECKIREKAWASLKAYSGILGLNPLDRRRCKLPPPKANPFAFKLRAANE